MKKTFYKKSKPSSSSKVKKNIKKRPNSLFFRNLIIAITGINILLLFSFIFILVLIKFTSLKDINFKETKVNFSYFTKRPDLLSSSKSLVVYDVNSGVILLSKNKNLRFSPASTTKIMSALVSLEYFNPDAILSVNSLENILDSSKMGLFIGERISVLSLIYGMLLPSGGDAAYVLAQNYPGGTEVFIKRMNEKAKEIGMNNTYFVDPAGYDDRNYSTALDLVKLGEKALKDKIIANVIKTKGITVFDEDGKIPHKLENLNELLQIPGVNGVKTGFTNEAEGVLITSLKNNGSEYLIVVLGSKNRFYDTKFLIQAILEDLKKDSSNQ